MDLLTDLKKLMEARNLSAYNIATETGISPSIITRYLKGSTGKLNMQNTGIIAAFLHKKGFLSDLTLLPEKKKYNISFEGKDLLDEFTASYAPQITKVAMIPASERTNPNLKIEDLETVPSPMLNIDLAIISNNDNLAKDLPEGSTAYFKKTDINVFVELGKVYLFLTKNGIIIKKIVAENQESLNLTDDSGLVLEIKKSNIFATYKLVATLTIK